MKKDLTSILQYDIMLLVEKGRFKKGLFCRIYHIKFIKKRLDNFKCLWYHILVQRDKQNKKTKEVKIMEIGMAIFFVVLAIGIWFFEGTKIGRKIIDYAVQKIVKDFEDLED